MRQTHVTPLLRCGGGTWTFLVLLLALLSSACRGGSVFAEFPKAIEKDQKYVFYSHGFIVEGEHETPEHPRYGVYDFPAIKQALSDPAYNLIAYHRPEDTDPDEFSRKLAQDVARLVEAGVPLRNVTLVGFSRGGVITALASDLVDSPDLNTVLLAACSGWVQQRPEIVLRGPLLSIYEGSDTLASSCQELAQRGTELAGFREIRLDTGKEHGAFYRPAPEWIEPVKRWIALASERPRSRP